MGNEELVGSRRMACEGVRYLPTLLRRQGGLHPTQMQPCFDLTHGADRWSMCPDQIFEVAFRKNC